MNLAEDLAQMIADFGALCAVQAQGENAPRNVRMIVQRISQRNNIFPSLGPAFTPQGADMYYGLFMVADAPEGMSRETRLKVAEDTGEVWELDAARPVYDVDEETGLKRLVAWRLLLRGAQRMVRR